MGRRGRLPAPNHLKVLTGVHPFRMNAGEVDAPDAGCEIVPPRPLPTGAQEVWDRLAPSLIGARLLTAWDVDMFETFCRSVHQYHLAANALEVSRWDKSGPALRAMRAAAETMKTAGARFGLTPGDRANLKVERDDGATGGAERLLS